MAALICIKMIRGTFFDFVNTANHFLHIFSDIVTSIRSLFPGGAGKPPFWTKLHPISWNLLFFIPLSRPHAWSRLTLKKLPFQRVFFGHACVQVYIWLVPLVPPAVLPDRFVMYWHYSRWPSKLSSVWYAHRALEIQQTLLIWYFHLPNFTEIQQTYYFYHLFDL